jgi:hypothetical protein
MEAPAARRLLKAANAETAEHAGTRILKILVMVNTRKKFPRGILDQVISLINPDGENESVRPGPGQQHQASTKLVNACIDQEEPQAPSSKLQATSSKPQAPWRYRIIIDMKDIMGYINLMIGLLIGQCAQAWNLQSSLPLKCRGVGRNSGLQAKPFFIYPKIQASSGKHQAPSTKVQAPSRKQQAPGSWTLQKVSSTFDQGTLPR